MSLPPDVLLLMADMKVEDVMDESVSGSVVEVSSAGRNTYENFQIAMKLVNMV